MKADRSTLLSILAVTWFVATSAGKAAIRDPLFYGLWTAAFRVAGGMMLLAIIAAPGQ